MALSGEGFDASLGSDLTLDTFMSHEDALIRAYDAAISPSDQTMISDQLTELQNRYPGLRNESLNVRHMMRIGEMFITEPSKN